MPVPAHSVGSVAGMWEVLTLFLIPVGGGIPAGVLLARSRGFGWPLMVILYFVSDLILACVFEPLMKGFIALGRRFAFFSRVSDVFKQAVEKSTVHYGHSRSPVALVLIAFGADPMTGRAAAVAAGHGFLSGWLIAITGDMFYFTLIMACTLWLKDVLGDGTWTMTVILVLMVLLPVLVRRIRARFGYDRPSSNHSPTK